MSGGRNPISLLFFFLSLVSCAAQQYESDFYNGLIKKQEDAKASIAHFEKALNAANACTAAASAAELLDMYSAGEDIPEALAGQAMRLITGIAAAASDGAEPEAAARIAASWAAALDALGRADPVQRREAALALLLGGTGAGGNRPQAGPAAWPPDEASRYVLRELRGGETAPGESGAMSAFALTEAENAAIDGRAAISRFRYGEALLFFRVTLRDSPGLFFRYPDLLGDLGRCFQYAAGREGMELFLEWEKALDGETAMREAIPPGGEGLVRFRLLFFAARMARQRGEKNIELFERALSCALSLAPEIRGEQADACIWYILDSSLAQSPSGAVRYLETYAPLWRDEAYFSDLMDKLARELIIRGQWDDVLNVFAIIGERPAAAAQYAWIAGRAMEEGFFPPGGTGPARPAAKAYIRAAYDAAAAALPGGKALYYRAAAAAVLGGPSPVLPDKAPGDEAPAALPEESDAVKFLLGFFQNGAARFASRYIRELEAGLTPSELRRVAESLAGEGRYRQSMRLVPLYAGKDGLAPARRDMELLYPRPFRELIERHAEETGLDPALLFALVRTESAFDSGAVSAAGAVGLTQLMPATADETAARIRRQGGPDYFRRGDGPAESAVDLKDPEANIHIGASYLAYLNGRMGDPLLALLAYNGGMGRVRRWRGAMRENLSPGLFLETVEFSETREYGRKVIAAEAVYRELYYQGTGD